MLGSFFMSLSVLVGLGCWGFVAFLFSTGAVRTDIQIGIVATLGVGGWLSLMAAVIIDNTRWNRVKTQKELTKIQQLLDTRSQETSTER